MTNVFVQHRDINGKQKGISAFAVRRGTPGLRQGKEALMMGMWGMVQNTVCFDDVPVTSRELLGKAGKGMEVAQDAMMYGRVAIAFSCLGGMKRCAQLMLRYTNRRQVSNSLVGEIATYAILLAATKYSYLQNPTTETKRAIALTELEFTHKINNALTATPDELVTQTEDITSELIDSYQQAIVNIQQNLRRIM